MFSMVFSSISDLYSLIRNWIQHFRQQKQQKKPSALTREHPALHWNFLIFFSFCGSFLSSWARIRIPDTDPLTWLNPDPDPGSETLVFRLRTHLHDGEQVGEVLIHGGGDGDQLIVAWLHDGAAGQVTWRDGQVTWRGAPAHQVLLSYLQSPYF